MKLCESCNIEPIPSNRTKHCSDACRIFWRNQRQHYRQQLGYRLVGFLEKNYPIILQRLVTAMESQKRIHHN
jgi:predicted nucleic acid-binding Zn ribbon protein